MWSIFRFCKKEQHCQVEKTESSSLTLQKIKLNKHKAQQKSGVTAPFRLCSCRWKSPTFFCTWNGEDFEAILCFLRTIMDCPWEFYARTVLNENVMKHSRQINSARITRRLGSAWKSLYELFMHGDYFEDHLRWSKANKNRILISKYLDIINNSKARRTINTWILS